MCEFLLINQIIVWLFHKIRLSFLPQNSIYVKGGTCTRPLDKPSTPMFAILAPNHLCSWLHHSFDQLIILLMSRLFVLSMSAIFWYNSLKVVPLDLKMPIKHSTMTRKCSQKADVMFPSKPSIWHIRKTIVLASLESWVECAIIEKYLASLILSQILCITMSFIIEAKFIKLS